jgi:hypothetical protein
MDGTVPNLPNHLCPLNGWDSANLTVCLLNGWDSVKLNVQHICLLYVWMDGTSPCLQHLLSLMDGKGPSWKIIICRTFG